MGVYVCYDCSGTLNDERRNWGHIGLSVGDGRVIHAWGEVRLNGYLAIQELEVPGWTKPRTIGWVPASDILRGMTRYITVVRDADSGGAHRLPCQDALEGS
jgi:hypothetical protein